jgi:hypothetical protein
VLRYFRTMWLLHADGSVTSTAVYCCDLVRVFVNTIASANMKNILQGVAD